MSALSPHTLSLSLSLCLSFSNIRITNGVSEIGRPNLNSFVIPRLQRQAAALRPAGQQIPAAIYLNDDRCINFIIVRDAGSQDNEWRSARLDSRDSQIETVGIRMRDSADDQMADHDLSADSLFRIAAGDARVSQSIPSLALLRSEKARRTRSISRSSQP